jgi:hypothetical protein
MNKVQKEYGKARELLFHCQEVSRMAEQEFIYHNGLSVKSLLEIEDDKEFDRLNEQFYTENARVEDSVIQAREALSDGGLNKCFGGKENDLSVYY